MTNPKPTVGVTGASGDIGRALAIHLARSGYAIARLDLADSDDADVRATGPFIACDLSDPRRVSAAIDDIEAVLGPLDGLVNNAAITDLPAPADIDDATWSQAVQVNLTAPFVLSRAVATRWRERSHAGAIVNVTSLAATLAFPDATAYNATKGALRTLTRSLAFDLARDGIRVNAVAPGAILTPKLERSFADDAARARAASWPPLGLGTPLDVAYAVEFLLSPRARYVTGHELVVDGGLSIGLRFPASDDAEST